MPSVSYLAALALAIGDARGVQLDASGSDGTSWVEKTVAATPTPTCILTGPNPWPSDCTCASWAQGDGSGGNETFLGTVATCQECLQLVLNTDPTAAGATFRAPGSSTSPLGECYLEHAWLYPNGDQSWITMPIPKMWMMIPGFGGIVPGIGTSGGGTSGGGTSAGWTGVSSTGTFGASSAPTSAGSTSATSAGTTSTAGISTGAAAAVGDPHLQNIHGERFDLMRPGRHVLIHIPRGMEKALLHVEADASRLGGSCADMYFQDLNITGGWVDAMQIGGLRFRAQDASDRNLNWTKFGKVEIKIAHGLTRKGIQYLNFYVKHLGRAGYSVGGLSIRPVPLATCCPLVAYVAG
ncbi:unnamed protein product [Prorocentrum cordatum]|uniref:Uncharacterized protein n=1 Tax=Prorocentrum cordatum TaxID=2364126 RepID=A0ABN9R0I8_9DINO|nr:unnamed protein product [Polarella glacialis]